MLNEIQQSSLEFYNAVTELQPGAIFLIVFILLLVLVCVWASKPSKSSYDESDNVNSDESNSVVTEISNHNTGNVTNSINNDISVNSYFYHKVTESFMRIERSKMTKQLRTLVAVRDNYTCQICGKQMHDGVGLHIDHIIPVSKGGKSTLSNLQVLCSKCNGRKGDRVQINYGRNFSNYSYPPNIRLKAYKIGMFIK